MRQLQNERLNAFINHAYTNTVFYRRRFDELKVKPADITSVEHLRKIPTTRFGDETRSEGFIAVPWHQLAEMLCCSAGAGPVRVLFLSQADVQRWRLQLTRLASFWGVRKGDVVMAGIPFPGAVLHGLVDAGAVLSSFVPASLSLDNQVKQLGRIRDGILFTGPGQIVDMVRRAKETGIDLGRRNLRMGILWGGSWAQSFRRRMEGELGTVLFDTYGSLEIGHPASECSAHDGMHIMEDLYVVEVLKFDKDEPADVGELGEVVVTPLWRDAMPVVRLRTGDVAALQEHKPCPCGRTMSKLSRIKGKIGQMVRVKGKSIFPDDVEDVLYQRFECSGEFQLVSNRPGSAETLRLKVECSLDEAPSASLRKKIEAAMEKALGVESEAELVHYGDLWRDTRLRRQIKYQA